MNSDPVQTYVSLVYPPADSSWIALCLIAPDHDRTEHRFATVDRLSRYLDYARFRNAHGWGVYVTPSLLMPHSASRRKESFQPQQTVIYLDCDRADCLERIKQRYPYPTLVVRTSRGRHQVYWRLDQPIQVAQQERLMSALAVDIGADRAATDVSRVLRLPGYWNRKPNRNNTVDIVFSRNHAVSYQSLMERAQPTPRGPTPPHSSTSTPRGAGTVLDELPLHLRRTVGHASESERDWHQVHQRLAFGHRPQDVVEWLREKRSDKPNPLYYAQLTVSKAVRSRANTIV